MDIVLRDQEKAGIDIVSGGGIHRFGSFTADLYGRPDGLRALKPLRKLGPTGHDQHEGYEAVQPLSAINGFGLIDEFLYLSTRKEDLNWRNLYRPYGMSTLFSEIINTELKAVVEASGTFIQLNVPFAAVHKDSPDKYVELFSRCVGDVKAEIGLHLCFGDYKPTGCTSYVCSSLPSHPRYRSTRNTSGN